VRAEKIANAIDLLTEEGYDTALLTKVVEESGEPESISAQFEAIFRDLDALRVSVLKAADAVENAPALEPAAELDEHTRQQLLNLLQK
jgi:hypothetical protein